MADSEKEIILVVDDEAKIRDVVRSYLELNGFTALCAQNGREGLALFEANPVSLILLDLMLPDITGEDFCARIRRRSDVPLIMLTARADEESVIRGLNLGADDYATKPFSPRQLMARVRAVLRRGQGREESGSDKLSFGGLCVDRDRRQVSLNGKALNLTKDEYAILTLLMSRPAKVFTRDEILEAVKGEDYGGFDRSVDSAVKRLRAKVEDSPKAPRYILTVYGLGYQFGEKP